MEFRRRHPIPVLMVLVSLFIVTPGILFQKANAQNAESDTTSIPTPLVTFQEMLKNPYVDLNLSREENKGKVIFDRFCAVCHGKSGDGNGFNAFNLESSFQVKPFNFTDSTAMAKITRNEIEKAIIGGGPAVGKSQYMPPWGKTLRPDEIQALIQYIYTFLRHPDEQ